MRKSLLCIGIVAAALLAPPLYGSESGPALIHSPEIVPESVAREAGIDNRHSRRFARVELDVDSLLHPAEPPREWGEPAEWGPLAQSTVTIEPFPGEIYRLNGRYVEEWTDSAWTWVGAIDGYESADLVLSIAESGYFGMMRVGPIVYEVRQGSDGQTYVREPEIAAYELKNACAQGLKIDHEEKLEDGRNLGEQQQAATASSGTAVIDILLLYSSAAATNQDIEALANSSVASLNLSFDDSNVNAVARIVHYSLVSGYTEDNPMTLDDILDLTRDMRNGTGDFSGVPGLRNTHSADLAHFIWDGSMVGSDTCGSAWTPNSASGNSTLFSGNTGDSCIAMYNNFTHEIGHNLGNDHDYPDKRGAFDYSHGFSFAGGGGVPEFRTIMGSDFTCSLSSCDRLNRWSDPNETYFSQAIGVTGEADAAQSLNTMRSVISNYRTPTGSDPSAISPVTVVRGLCFDDNWVNYNAPSGLLGWYEIQTDSNSSFSSPTAFYRGVKTSVPLSVFSTTWMRARACNSSGCSGWTNGSQAATYTAGCL